MHSDFHRKVPPLIRRRIARGGRIFRRNIDYVATPFEGVWARLKYRREQYTNAEAEKEVP